MRIIGGIYKGRTLYGFEGKDIRPTSDMVRESLFNILQTKIYGTTFLDLFCGTGAVGIEALSRGAKHVVFNDRDRKSLALTEKNLQKCKAEGYTISLGDGVSFLANTNNKFDVIFIDPPYKTTLGEDCLKIACNALTDNGIIVFESDKPCNQQFDGLICYDVRKYGKAHLTFFKRDV